MVGFHGWQHGFWSGKGYSSSNPAFAAIGQTKEVQTVLLRICRAVVDENIYSAELLQNGSRHLPVIFRIAVTPPG